MNTKTVHKVNRLHIHNGWIDISIEMNWLLSLRISHRHQCDKFNISRHQRINKTKTSEFIFFLLFVRLFFCEHRKTWEWSVCVCVFGFSPYNTSKIYFVFLYHLLLINSNVERMKIIINKSNKVNTISEFISLRLISVRYINTLCIKLITNRKRRKKNWIIDLIS